MQIPGRRFAPNETVITSWMPRGGDGIIFRCEIISREPDSAPGTPMTITVTLQTRNQDGDDSVSDKATLTLNYSAAEGAILEKVFSLTDSSGCKEMVRFKIEASTSSDSDSWYTIRILPPVFFDAASE
jgi:hypothetical protein